MIFLLLGKQKASTTVLLWSCRMSWMDWWGARVTNIWSSRIGPTARYRWLCDTGHWIGGRWCHQRNEWRSWRGLTSTTVDGEKPKKSKSRSKNNPKKTKWSKEKRSCRWTNCTATHTCLYKTCEISSKIMNCIWKIFYIFLKIIVR